MLNFSNRQTTLDLNGPVLSIVQQPTSVSICNAGVATFVGLATATFPTQEPTNTPTNTGILTQRWYVDGYGPLIDGSIVALGITVVGSATTTLTISGAINPTANGLSFFMRPDYIPSAYSQPVGSTVVAGTARSTGNGNNEPYDSSVAILTVFPTITITNQPDDISVAATRSATFVVSAETSDGSSLSYQWLLNGNNLTDSSLVSGSNTQSLTITLNTVGINTVQAVISHPNSCDSPKYSDVATFTVVEPRQIINYESVNDGGSFFGSGSINLFDNPTTFTADPNNNTRSLVIYPPEKDIRCRVTIAAGAGQSRNGYSGGQGGLSVFEYTFKQNTEYTIKLGSATAPTGGANGGGGAAFLYEKGRLVAVCGGGGGAGSSAAGGSGGGIGVGGQRGSGRLGGNGGSSVSIGALPTGSGFFPGRRTSPPAYNGQPSGGQVSGCTIGNYWRSRGFSPCQDVGFVQWFAASGRVVSQTTNSINRGYKGGIGYRNNGGNGSGDNGGGGSGAYGGSAGTGSGSAGGGGSGYTNGTIDLISTQLGGNTSTNSFIRLEPLF